MGHLMPKESYSNISDISLDYLINDIHIKGLIFFFFCTLIRNKIVSVDTLNFLKRAKERGLKLSILSNNPYVSKTILKTINITATKKFACKPLKKPFLDMAKTMKLMPEQIAVIGNNRISDIWGANRANMYSIYIHNLNSHRTRKRAEDTLNELGIKHVK